MSYQGILLLMYWLALPVFDSIQAAATVSTALKRKLSFLVTVFCAAGAEITLSEVNPMYVTARYKCMMQQDGFGMNTSSLKTLLMHFMLPSMLLELRQDNDKQLLLGSRGLSR